MLNSTRQGYLFALSAYVMWGLAPIYFKLIKTVPPTEIIAHRAIWSFVFMGLLLTITKNWTLVRTTLKTPKKCLLLIITAFLTGTNWLIYIWAVNNDHMLDASFGYFITPLMNMLLGYLFLQERFTSRQKVALFLALCGVLIQLWQLGTFPLIALGLAFSFGTYGLLRKKIGVDAQSGMLIETLVLLPVAMMYLFLFANSATSNPLTNPSSLNLLLITTGIVTTLPLLCFTAAAIRLPLSVLGFFQYIGPTLTFILAVTIYGEQASTATLVVFGFIWLALAIFVWDAIERGRRVVKG